MSLKLMLWQLCLFKKLTDVRLGKKQFKKGLKTLGLKLI